MIKNLITPEAAKTLAVEGINTIGDLDSAVKNCLIFFDRVVIDLGHFQSLEETAERFPIEVMSFAGLISKPATTQPKGWATCPVCDARGGACDHCGGSGQVYE